PVPVLLVGRSRPGDAAGRLERTIARLRREDIALRLDVPGLDEAEIDGLIRGLGLGEPTHQLVTTVSATTRGNPLFIQELLHHLVKHGALRRRGGSLGALGDLGAVRLPKELTSVIGARTRPLESRCRRVLEYASLLGTRFSPRTLAAVSDVGEDELLGLLEEAVRQRILVSDGPVFEFLHPLVRQALASEPSGLRVQRMHARI